jgi:Protein of unknown function (DUF3179)
MRWRILFLSGLLLLIISEIARIYFIMPFPGSQQGNMIALAYFLNKYIWLFRAVGFALIATPVFRYLAYSRWWKKSVCAALLIFYGIIFYLANNVMQADRIFIQPRHKTEASVSNNKIGMNDLVIGLAENGAFKAYPIQLIGYHHQVRDTVGGIPVIVTYCTVCRTGRVYSPYIHGVYQQFRLVGMDHFNAMFEDETTKSWWRQENGEAIAGPLKGEMLSEIPSQQVTLKWWISQHPNTLIMQPDPSFTNAYDELKGYDDGSIGGVLEGTNKNSWQLKSWVIGIQMGSFARAYDWNDLKQNLVINDTLNKTAVVLILQNDSMTFRAWNATVNQIPLQFMWDDTLSAIRDVNTHSLWNYDGLCVGGTLNGARLSPIPSYQEFWHSWKTFHPNTTQFKEEAIVPGFHRLIAL